MGRLPLRGLHLQQIWGFQSKWGMGGVGGQVGSAGMRAAAPGPRPGDARHTAPESLHSTSTTDEEFERNTSAA